MSLLLMPDIQRQVSHLQVNKVCQVRAVSAGTGVALQDRFLLDISYCGLTMRWQVIFQQINVQWVPDFVFNHPGFFPLDSSNPHRSELREAILNFDIEDVQQLNHIVTLLLSSYSRFQLAQLQAVSWIEKNMRWELDSILAQPETRLAYIPGAAGGTADQVRFAVQLPVNNLASLQPFVCNTWATEYEYEQVTIEGLMQQLQLVVVYTLNKSQGVVGLPELQLEVPRPLEAFIGLVQLPEWIPAECNRIIDYVPRCVGRIESLIRSVQEPLVRRYNYLQQLVAALGRPLEIDTVHARSAVFIIALESSSFVLSVYLQPTFPQEQPRLMLQVQNPVPDLIVYKDYPWSPRWAPQEMVARAVIFVREKIMEIKANSSY